MSLGVVGILLTTLSGCSDARGYNIGPYDLSTMDADMKIPRQDMEGNYLPITDEDKPKVVEHYDSGCAHGTGKPNC